MKRITIIAVLLGLLPLMTYSHTTDKKGPGTIEQTSTGFYYPLGRKDFDSRCGKWLARDTDPRNRLKQGDCYFRGLYHIGIDMMGEEGDPIYAISDGEVFTVLPNDGEGNEVVYVKHKLTDKTEFLALYGHVTTSVKEGQKIEGGKEFAKVGLYSSGNHLHFSIRPDLRVAPIKYAKDKDGKSVKIGWGRGSNYFWPNTNGFVDPINWIRTKSPYISNDVSYVPSQKVGLTRIQFGGGESSATVSGKLSNSKLNQSFIIGARAGQELNVQVKAESTDGLDFANILISDPSGKDIAADDRGFIRIRLKQTGDYRIDVTPPGSIYREDKGHKQL